MTEAEWVACEDPRRLMEHLLGRGPGARIDNRALRLYAVAVCRLVWAKLSDERSRTAVEVAERLADGGVPEPERRAVYEAAMTVSGGNPAIRAYQCIDASAQHAANCAARLWDETPAAVRAGLLRDVFGNPFRAEWERLREPMRGWAAWNDHAVSQVARAAYGDRRPDGAMDAIQLAVLADGLEEAGCTGLGVMEHLRSAGPHVRGCWAVDLVLGKS